MATQPLADRIRPESLEDIVGQRHLVGENGVVRKLLECGRIPNMIFFGPPGTGKTTLANIIAKKSNMQLFKLNATSASISDIKEVISSSDTLMASTGTLLYLDEIQYFNRKQQQSLLEFIENGKITLIASTTENPYYYIYNAILSRCMVFEFKSTTPDDCLPSLKRALNYLNNEFGTSKVATDTLLIVLAESCGGDVRMAINLLENAYYISGNTITEEVLRSLMPTHPFHFDRDGDVHYDLLSCLQKSVRGSDPNAAIFYLAKILAGGDMISAIRRLQVIASEDIGLAYPMAATIVRSCCESAKELGLPEAAIPLANATILLATSPKSNTAHDAYFKAKEELEKGFGTQFPKHLRSPEFKGYLYPHIYPYHYVKQQYLPDDISDHIYYEFGDNKTEQAAKAYWDMIMAKIK